MMNWDQTDKLNEIATDPTKSANAKKSEILHFMRLWAIEANTTSDGWDFTPDWSDPRIPREPVIDASSEATRARLPITGQTGRTWYPGQ